MLQGVQNGVVNRQRLNFGSANVAPMPPGVVNPAPISENPYREKISRITNDPYGLKSNNADMQPFLANNQKPNIYSSIDPQSRRKGSILKPIITGAVLIGGGVLAYKKRKNIGNFFKKLVGKKPKTDPQKEIKTVTGFNNYVDDMNRKIADDKITEVKLPEQMTVILKGKTTDEKRALLTKAYDVADTSARLEVQPKIKVMMGKEIKNDADGILDLLKDGKVNEISNAHIDEIGGFEIIKTPHKHNEIAVEKHVRYGKNVDSTQDRMGSWWRRFIETLRRP